MQHEIISAFHSDELKRYVECLHPYDLIILIEYPTLMKLPAYSDMFVFCLFKKSITDKLVGAEFKLEFQ